MDEKLDINNTDITNNDINEKIFKNDNEIIKRLKEINDKLDSFDLDPDPDPENNDLKKSNQKNTIIAFIILIVVGGILFVSKWRINANN